MRGPRGPFPETPGFPLRVFWNLLENQAGPCGDSQQVPECNLCCPKGDPPPKEDKGAPVSQSRTKRSNRGMLCWE